MLRAMKAPGKFDGFMFDVRSNPGGSAGDALRISGSLFDQEPVGLFKALQLKDGKPTALNETIASKYPFSDKPVFVMVNKKSASAAELFARSIQDNGRGAIFGEGTYGKGVQQSPFTLDDGSSLLFTNVIRTSIDGSPFHRVGVKQNLSLPSLSGTDAANSESLEVSAPDAQAVNSAPKQTGKYWRTDPKHLKVLQNIIEEQKKISVPFKELHQALDTLSGLNQSSYPLHLEKAREEGKVYAQALQKAVSLGGDDSPKNFDQPGFLTQVSWDLAVTYLELMEEEAASQKARGAK